MIMASGGQNEAVLQVLVILVIEGPAGYLRTRKDLSGTLLTSDFMFLRHDYKSRTAIKTPDVPIQKRVKKYSQAT
jgi:hypothetical protein